MKEFFSVAFVLVVLVILAGWVMNIISLFSLEFSSVVTVEALLRIIGIVVVPLGGVMGYL